MPNWCSNSLLVEGPERVLAAWVAEIERNAGSDVGLLGTFVVPEYNKDESNWWSAHLNAWDTKWDVEINKLDWDRYLDAVKLRFDTAWSPPESWLLRMSKDWPSLVFKLAYEEPGMNFMGYTICKDNEAWGAWEDCVEWEFSEDELMQEKLDDAYYAAMEERREQLRVEASDAYEKAMYE
jgi:hypothetical protein